MKTYYCDASTFRNGQPGQDSAILIYCPDGEIIRERIGNCSINVAEMTALYQAADLASKGDILVTDSELSWKWITKPFKKTKNNGHIEPIAVSIKQLVGIKELKITWMRRNENLAGIEIENNPFY